MSNQVETPVTLPFTLQLQELPDDPNRPALQSQSWMRMPDGGPIIMLGGRTQGLHHFRPGGGNFPGPNTSMWMFDPAANVTVELFDLRLLDPQIGSALMSTDQQSYYDAETGNWLIVGGYGQDAGTGQPKTFDTLIQIPVVEVVGLLLSGRLGPQELAQLLQTSIRVEHDPFFQVTGGSLRKLGGRYVLGFGQRFDGPYNPFLRELDQEYINAIRFFRIDPQTGLSMGKGEMVSPDADQPFHRRDGVVVDSLDPATGAPRIAAFGGVFAPGKLSGYGAPVYIQRLGSQLTASTDRTFSQSMNPYQCPVMVAWDPANKVVYQTFFGGISHSFYNQTAAQQNAYNTVTAEGRNDGMPFVTDISVIVQDSLGNSQQLIAPLTFPNSALRGAATDFIPASSSDLPAVGAGGVIDLQALPPGPTVVGYIYGGIDADFPLPLIPNFGTQATSAAYQVIVTPGPNAAYIPASAATVANGVIFPPTRDAA